MGPGVFHRRASLADAAKPIERLADNRRPPAARSREAVVQSLHELVAAFEQVADARIGQHDRLAGWPRRGIWLRCNVRQIFQDGAGQLINIGERSVMDILSLEMIAEAVL